MYPSTGFDGDGPFHSEVTPRASYRREFEEMENRIRKCERQRAELERRFAELMNERAECERAEARAMKQRQRRKMEAERQRAERNESILRMLNKIDQQAVSLAAKTDRLKMLKTQYEMYLMRTWSSPAYTPPMITAPPAMVTKQSQTPSSKSEFVQYLADLTHQQATNINPIPPPTALSNYLASQRQSFAPVASYTAPTERPCSRAFSTVDVPLGASGSGLSPVTFGGGTKAKKFDMSNEDFIRYIDSEVLKEPIPKVSIEAPSPEVTRPEGAYLEDATLSEDEHHAPVGTLSDKLEQFSMLVESVHEQTKAIGESTNILPKQEEYHSQGDEVLEAGADENWKNVEPIRPKETPLIEKCHAVVTDAAPMKEDDEQTVEHGSAVQGGQELRDELDKLDVGGSHEVSQPEPHLANSSPPLETYQLNPEYNTADYNVSAADKIPVQEDHTLNEMVDNNVAQPEETSHANPQYITEGMVPEDTQQLQQPIQTSGARNQHWSTARQAMRSKAFPGGSFYPPPAETIQAVENPSAAEYPTGYEATSVVAGDVDPSVSQGQYEPADQSASVENTAQDPVYVDYAADSNEVKYSPTGGAELNSEEQPPHAASGPGYPEDGMGHPVEYQESHYQPSQLDEQTANYQYAVTEGQQGTYQEGQYLEGGTADQSQYQYQEGVDQTGDAYANQEAYQGQEQQYQYDENSQYYGQQQGYEGQYYSEDPQQQHQQYYTEESYQQPHEAQYEQGIVDPNSGQAQQSDVPAYYSPDGQLEPTPQKPESVEPIASSEELGGTLAPTDNVLQTEPDQTMGQPSTLIDSTARNDKQEKLPEQKPAGKDSDPASDAPTLSTVNDESDFDFSTQ